MENFLNDLLFQAIFNSPVPRIIVKADAPVFTIVISNDAHKAATNLIGREIEGKSVWEIFDPNEAGGDGGTLLLEALTKAQTTNSTVLMPPFRYDMGSLTGEGMTEMWWQLEIVPICRNGQSPEYLLTTTNNITDQILREREKESTQKLLESLVEQRTSKLASSEEKFRNIVEHSPVAMALLIGEELVLDALNFEMLKLWQIITGRSETPDKLTAITGKKLTTLLGSTKERYLEVLRKIFQSGQSFIHPEFAYGTEALGASKYAYISINPIFDQTGQVSALIVSANDVTEQVNSRKELENAYEQIRLSKLAAQLGTFDLNLITNEMEWDARCRELFGISHNAEVTYEGDFLVGLHPDDRDRVQATINSLFNNEIADGIYDVEYRTVGVEDHKVRWLRAKGKVYFDAADKPVRFIGSVLDITEQKHEEEIRNDFISMVSHELKTPLTSVQGYVQLLHRKALKTGDQAVLPILVQTERQIAKMGKMINGFLNVSRLEAGKLALELSDVCVNSLIEEAVAEIRISSPDTNLSLIKGEDVQVRVDREKIGQVLLNLLGNAVKYSDRLKPIAIQYHTAEDKVVISIKDEGIGINETDLKRLFDRFYRVENAHTRFVSGFGVGLYLCKEIVLLHGGQIWAESEAGKGSVFSFSIPRASAS